MKEDDITAYLQQFSLEQLDEIKQLVLKKADDKKRQAEELRLKREKEALRRKKQEEDLRLKRQAAHRKPQQPMRAVGGMPPSPPKDIAALAEAADLDISGLLRDIDRRKR
ncbi:hypothetical protein KQ940_16505 [Marinobacterium sp. D7]|uniref:hypothetical protein n=1 Tax=Marinobacterium ramblicola TaxID=2849041 RepID=UPI001C2DE5DD|nr:hypothetical protein [Marinobacterium ramblicola]MBV1789657.1 hypothetical protein [Marinobacterium ramblicola]